MCHTYIYRLKFKAVRTNINRDRKLGTIHQAYVIKVILGEFLELSNDIKLYHFFYFK